VKRRNRLYLLALLSCISAGIAWADGLDLSGLRPGAYRSIVASWDFWWDRYVDPQAATSGSVKPDAQVPFPGTWKSFSPTGGASFGYATLHLRLRGLDPREEWALKLGSVLSAARLFVNGVEVLSFGRTGTDAESEQPDWGSRVVGFSPDRQGTADLVLYISNFHDREGGTTAPILVGDRDALVAAQGGLKLFEVFVLGALSVMGLYFLFLFFFRPQDRSSLYFALLCLSLALRSLCYDEYFILDLLPNLSWLWLFRLGYLMFALPVLFLLGVIYSLYPKQFTRPAFIVAALLCLAYAVAFATLPTVTASRMLLGFQLITLVAGSYVCVTLLRAMFGRKAGSILLTAGFFVLFGAAVHDILVAAGKMRGLFVVQYGLLAFLFSMSVVITRSFAASFSRAEALSAELVRTNRALKRFVPEEFLGKLGKSSIEQVALGDHAAMEMTVMFADIRQFSRISEGLSAEDNFRFLNQYLARMGPAVRDHGGFVDKYIGDGIMALFPGSPADALDCALEMQRRLRAYNELRAASGAPAIRTGIGIHTGLLMLGTIGENERMDGTVISDAVNIASRIEGLTKEFSIGLAVSGRILESLPDRSSHSTRYLGKVGIRGKREPVPVYEVFDEDPEPLKSRKSAVCVHFEKALDAFYCQDYPAALALLNRVEAELPSDEACAHYTRIVRKLNMA